MTTAIQASAPEEPEKALPLEKQRSYRERIRSTVRKLAAAFKRVDGDRRSEWSRGDLAQLRRMEVKRPDATDLVFCRIVTQELEEPDLLHDHSREQDFHRWVAVLQGLATVYDQHDSKVRLGTALFRAGLSDQRLTKLLKARGAQLWTEIRRLAHLVRSRGEKIPWDQVAVLMLTEDAPDSERQRRTIASDYYRERFRSDKEMKSNHNETN